MVGPSTTLINEEHSSSTTAVIEPGSVIELDDLLDGVHDAGQIGKTIKEIVNNIRTRPDSVFDDETTTSVSAPEENTEPSTETPITPVREVTTLAPSFSSSSEKTTPSLNSAKNLFPAVYIPSQQLPKHPKPSTEDKSMVIFSTQSTGSEPEPSVSTRYVTSIEKSIKTLTLTSTKVSISI